MNLEIRTLSLPEIIFESQILEYSHVFFHGGIYDVSVSFCMLFKMILTLSQFNNDSDDELKWWYSGVRFKTVSRLNIINSRHSRFIEILSTLMDKPLTFKMYPGNINL